MRIFIGLTEVAGYFSALGQGLRDIGVKADFIVYYDSKFSYGGDFESSIWVRIVKRLCRKAGAIPPEQTVRRAWWRWVRDFFKFPLFIWALIKYDVFVFSYHSSFFTPRFYSHYEYPVLKFFGKKLIFVFLGSDSRPPYLNGVIVNNQREVGAEECIRLAKEKKELMNYIGKYADVIVDIPPQGVFHEKPFVMLMHLGFPRIVNPQHDLPPEAVPEEGEAGGSKRVRILHAPSSPATKGTYGIRQCMERLKERGYEFDYVEVQNVPNQEVKRQLALCDFVVDELYSDAPMPGLATEAAWLGKPVVLGGYASTYWSKWLPGEMMPPTFFCQPDEAEAAIEKMIADAEFRSEMGRKARQYVEQYCTPGKVAEKFMHLVNGNIPDDWWYDPRDNPYPYGYGMPKEKLARVVKQMIDAGGIESLQLRDKPELEQMLQQLANSSERGESLNPQEGGRP